MMFSASVDSLFFLLLLLNLFLNLSLGHHYLFVYQKSEGYQDYESHKTYEDIFDIVFV